MCPYQFYKENETYYPKLYCKLREGKTVPYCVYSKRCEIRHKYISLDKADDCYVAKEAKSIMIPRGSYYVRTYKLRNNGTYSLYVDINGMTQKINTTFTNFNQDYIYLDEVEGVYVPSLTPIIKPIRGRKGGKKEDS